MKTVLSVVGQLPGPIKSTTGTHTLCVGSLHSQLHKNISDVVQAAAFDRNSHRSTLEDAEG